MKKKLFALMLAFAMVFSMSACSSGTTETTDDTDTGGWDDTESADVTVLFDSTWLNGTTFDAEVTDVSDDYTEFDISVEYEGEDYEIPITDDGSGEDDPVYSFSDGTEASAEDLKAGQTITMTLDDDGYVTEVVINE